MPDETAEKTIFTVRVRFLAVPPGTLKSNRMEVEVTPGTTVGDLIKILADEYPVLYSYTRFVSAAVNRAYVGMQTELHEGDEVIYSPPVGGG
jgi:molybdopterin synthase catalytic subunit/molybdopterin synthase sulfur carrier subunit